MARFIGFLAVVIVSYISTQGQIVSAEETEFVFLPGSIGYLKWIFHGDVSSLDFRAWYFISNGGLRERLATIAEDNNPKIRRSSLSGVEVVKPATLLLKNVNQSYNGIYRFTILMADGQVHSHDVRVFIAMKPNVTINCSSAVAVNEGDDVTCLCRGEGGNPPANVTWFKDGVQIGEIGTENKTLTMSNVSRQDAGTYSCVAQSHKNFTFADEKSIKIIVRYKPENTTIMFTPVRAVCGQPVNITCMSDGFPEPSYTITHNGSLISNKTKHTIQVVNWSDSGTYKCLAKNELGNDSASTNFTVEIIEHRPTTSPASRRAWITSVIPIPTRRVSTTNKLIVGIVIAITVGTVIGVMVLLGIVIVVVYYCKPKLSIRNTVSPTASDSDETTANHHELSDNVIHEEDGNVCDTVNSSETSESESNPTERQSSYSDETAAMKKNSSQTTYIVI